MLRYGEPKVKHVDWDTPYTDSTSPGIHSEVTGEARGVRQAVAFLLSRASQGLATGAHIMSTVLKKRNLNNLGVVPTNRLNGNNQNSSRLARSPPPRNPLSPPPLKRQKCEANRLHTQSHFVVAPEHDGTTDRPNPRKRSFDNQSDSQHTLISQSSNPRGAQPTQSNVAEFRTAESFGKVPPKKRARRNTVGERVDGMSSLGADPDSDGDVQVVEDPKPTTTFQKFKQPQRESRTSISDLSKRFGGGHHKTVTSGNRPTSASLKLDKIIDKTERKENKRKSADSSPDELALETQDIRGRWANKGPITPSPSLSKRGDIQRTKFSASSHTQGTQETTHESDLDRATKIIGSRLCIRRAVSGFYKYEAEKASSLDECFLKLRDMSFILHPANLNGDILKQYAYCTVNMKKVKSIVYSSDPKRCIASIGRSADAGTSASAKLLIEFSSPEDLENFKTWAGMDLQGVLRRDLTTPAENPDDLEKTLNHMMTQATRSFAITDDEPKGEDVQLMEHNAAVRNSRQVQSSSRAHAPTTQAKVKDLMRSQVPPTLSNSKPAVIPDNPRPYNTQRPVRTTRSTFTLKNPDMESESPEPVGWTTKNKGWEKNWRNSLVFPPQGKNRATVDREDIPRLDEGEFLNDNLLIFYLRYLQHSLEATRPDLAQRIYFQNTFFYERLRSSRTNQGINYDSVKTWTSKVDLFTKDYIIVPINEFSHWYVAIIYNAPKLLPSSDRKGDFGTLPKESITIEEDADGSGRLPSASPRNEKLSKSTNTEALISAVQNDVTNHLSRMSISSPGPSNSETKQTIAIDSEKQKEDTQSSGHEQDVEVVGGTDDSKADVGQILPPNGSLQKKAKKRQSVGHRKYSPDQPRIITLDSLGISHSPACSCLKQYLIAELKDKKDIEIPNPGALGMTARDLPEQSNHCDCGLYLLGYIKEFLKDPDTFVRQLLQYNKDITWDFDPSRLRSEIRDLIFRLQKEQQDREDAEREDKRKGGLLKRKKPAAEHQPLELNTPPPKEQVVNQGSSEPLKKWTICEEDEAVVAPEPKSPALKVPRPESRPTSDSEQSRDVPGSFPQSPIVKSPDTMEPSVVAGGDNAKRTESQRFVSPLPSSTCGSSSTRAMVIDDSEASQGQKKDIAHAHSSPKRPASPVVIQDSPQSVKNHKTSVIERRTQEETPVTSPYFAGRHPGDKMARATLHQEPVKSHDVVDISD
ncbi:cysteine proteinase [Hypoxylon sp. FL0890]|nr:cysteine proteinase [Hypoxylon sp. FL0890]